MCVVFRFEEQQPLKFEVCDVDSTSPKLTDHDFLGFVTCNLGQLISNGKVSWFCSPVLVSHLFQVRVPFWKKFDILISLVSQQNQVLVLDVTIHIQSEPYSAAESREF